MTMTGFELLTYAMAVLCGAVLYHIAEQIQTYRYIKNNAVSDLVTDIEIAVMEHFTRYPALPCHTAPHEFGLEVFPARVISTLTSIFALMNVDVMYTEAEGGGDILIFTQVA